MADEGAETQTEQPKKSSPIPMIGVIAVVMVLEAVGVAVLVSMMGGDTTAAAVAIEDEELAALEAPVEVKLVDGRFLNMSTGRAWQWTAEIYIRVRQKHVEKIEGEIESRQYEIMESVSVIFARAQNVHLQEPGRETLKAQLLALTHTLFGVDDDEEPRVEDVMIVGYRGSPIDY